MAAKPGKEKTSKKDASPKLSEVKKSSAKPKKTLEEDDLDVEEDETKLKAGKRSLSAKSKSDDADEAQDDFNDIEDEDNRKKGDEDEDWDPDFDEFDLPKSSKKIAPVKKSKDNEDDYKIDDEFKDLFGSKSSSKKYNEDDDY